MLSKMKFFSQCHTDVEQCSWDLNRDLSDSRTYLVILQIGPQPTDSESPREQSWISSLDLSENLHFNRSSCLISLYCTIICCLLEEDLEMTYSGIWRLD